MNGRHDVERRHGIVAVAAAVTTVVAFWVTNSSTPPDGYLNQALPLAVFAAPAAIAAWLLWRAWWARTGSGLPAMDVPALLLAAAVAAAPEERREWARAMAAELGQVRDPLERWRFAGGCARAAMFPPRSSRLPVLAVGGLAVLATVLAGLAAGYALPAVRVFAVTFVVLVGALATLAVARSRRFRGRTPDPAVVVAGLAGVLACGVGTVYFVAAYPSAAAALRPAIAMTLAVLLAGCLWLTVAPPRTLAAGRLSGRLAVGVALVLVVGFVLVSRLLGDQNPGMAIYLFVAPLLCLLGSVLAAGLDASFRSGVRAAVYATALGILLLFVAWLVEAPRWYANGAGLLLDAETGIPVGQNLADAATWPVALLLMWGLPFGVIGAALGNAGRRWLARPRSS